MFQNLFGRGNIFFSERLCRSSYGKKIAAIAVFTALSVVTNMLLEIKIFDIQFSLTIFFSAITGMFIGPLAGFFACVLGDFVGYVFNSWGQLYMPWVGVSTGLFAFIAGLVFANSKDDSFKITSLKILIYALLTFIICTVTVNSTGFYIYNKYVVGLSKSFLSYVEERFGGNSGFFVYLIYRLIFKGQIWNSVANYALLFAFFPLLKGLLRRFSV